jgi:hypothetical protein
MYVLRYGSLILSWDDSDTITSHDKKRNYLESLEQYVLWLHEQIHFVGHSPLRLERVDDYRGLCSRSIRVRVLLHRLLYIPRITDIVDARQCLYISKTIRGALMMSY